MNSKRATQFRIWATSVLKNHIINGYTLNQKRLQEKGLNEFEEAVGLIKKTLHSRMLTDDETRGLLEVITGYSSTWILLQKYDKATLAEPKLYFVIKDHPFTDGNKRIGSFLFIVYLAKNSYLYRKNGEKKITDNTLTALALLIAESDPKHKKLMILLIMNFLTDGN